MWSFALRKVVAGTSSGNRGRCVLLVATLHWAALCRICLQQLEFVPGPLRKHAPVVAAFADQDKVQPRSEGRGLKFNDFAKDDVDDDFASNHWVDFYLGLIRFHFGTLPGNFPLGRLSRPMNETEPANAEPARFGGKLAALAVVKHLWSL